MEQMNSAEKCRAVQLSSGLTVVVHYARDRPSLQDCMIRILGKYQNGAKDLTMFSAERMP